KGIDISVESVGDGVTAVAPGAEGAKDGAGQQGASRKARAYRQGGGYGKNTQVEEGIAHIGGFKQSETESRKRVPTQAAAGRSPSFARVVPGRHSMLMRQGNLAWDVSRSNHINKLRQQGVFACESLGWSKIFAGGETPTLL